MRVRLFLTVWIIYAVHFATNVVREHYPAFSLVENGTFRVDEYFVENPDAPGRSAFHADIFRHRDGHAYIGNNVATSVVAAGPLLLFRPLLDALAEHGKQQRQAGTPMLGDYRSDKPNRQKLWQVVKERGLELRFGAAAVITSVFLMAPLSALSVVLLHHCLTVRGLRASRAAWLALLFAFGTPLFFRTAHLSNNLMVMYATFAAFYLLWIRPDMAFPVTLGRRLLAGFLCGAALAFDYHGVVPLLAFYGYLVLNRLRSAGMFVSIRESFPFILGSVPPVLFLLYSQWAMYGNPFLPGQYWMPDVAYTDRGWRGYDWPAADLFWLNLFDWSYGLYTFGPILLVGLLPAWFYAPQTLIVPRPDRRFLGIYVLVFLVFCAANQYSRMQWNSGFRYLVPLVPLIYLVACDHLARLPRGWLVVLTAAAVMHSWVIAMFRETVPESWSHFLDQGAQLPWLSVLRKAVSPEQPLIQHPLLPLAVLGVAGLAIALVWLPRRKPAPPQISASSLCEAP